MRIQWQHVIHNDRTNVWDALITHPMFANEVRNLVGQAHTMTLAELKAYVGENTAGSVDSWATRKFRGARKAIARNPKARGVAATVMVAGGVAITVATGGVAAIAAAGAAGAAFVAVGGVPLSACALRLAILTADSVAYASEGLDKQPMMKRFKQYDDAGRTKIDEAYRISQAINDARTRGEDVRLDALQSCWIALAKGMHQWAKREAHFDQVGAAMAYCVNYHGTNQRAGIDEMWNRRVTYDEDTIAVIAGSLISALNQPRHEEDRAPAAAGAPGAAAGPLAIPAPLGPGAAAGGHGAVHVHPAPAHRTLGPGQIRVHPATPPLAGGRIRAWE